MTQADRAVVLKLYEDNLFRSVGMGKSEMIYLHAYPDRWAQVNLFASPDPNANDT